MQRVLTRRERYAQKRARANLLPVELATVSLMHDGNLGYLIRTAACFGARRLHVIGAVPPRSSLNPLSGSLYDFVEIKQWKTTSDFLQHCRDEKKKLYSIEISENSRPLETHRFSFDQTSIIFTGHEEAGVPGDVLLHSTPLEIAMPGIGFCLNTSQAANITLYEFAKQHGGSGRASL